MRRVVHPFNSLQVCLKWVGIPLSLDSARDEIGFCFRFYWGILALACLVLGTAKAWEVHHFLKSIYNFKLDFEMLIYTEAIIGIISLATFVLRRKRIVSTIREIIRFLPNYNHGYSTTWKYLQKRSKFLITFGYTSCLLATFTTISQSAILPIEKIQAQLETCYFGIRLQGYAHNRYLYLFFTFQLFVLITTFVDFYLILLTFISDLLHQCYEHCNISAGKLEDLSCHQLHLITQKHQQIASLVDKVNQLFSPMLFFEVIFRTVKIMFLIGQGLGDHKYYAGPEWISNFNYIFNLIKATSLFLTFILSAAKIFAKSQRTVKVLLSVYLKNPTSKDEDSVECKNYQVTTLFVAQQLISPVGITGSNLFVINYNFLAVVISTIVTYLSLLSGV